MHLPMPDGSGWFDLLDVGQLNAGHQDDYQDLGDELREKKRASLPPPEPDPANPAVMTEPSEQAARLTRKEVRPIYDLVLSWIVTGTSYGVTLPWGEQSRAQVPLPAWNMLRQAVDDYYLDALNGIAPKPETGPTSSTTSPEPAPVPLPGPAPEPSGTPAGS